MRQAAVPAEPDLDINRIRSPDRRRSAGKVGKAKAETSLRRDADVFAVEMADDHRALGFTWASNSHMNLVPPILGPARDVVDAAAAAVINNLDCLGSRWPCVQRRKHCCNNAVSYRVTSHRHFQAFGVFFDLWRPPNGRKRGDPHRF